VSSPKIRQTGITDVAFGENVVIVEPVNLYGCQIADDVFVGPFVEIQKGAMIGSHTRIQSHSFICEQVEIGEDCVVAHGVMFINDRYSAGHPARGDQSLWEKTTIKDRVSIGSNATILPVTICNDVVIGAGSIVTHDIDEPGIYAGNPAKKIRNLP